MLKPIVLLLILTVSVSAAEGPEMRVWNMNDGSSVKAAFVYRMRGDIVLKPPRGKDLKIPVGNFSDEDLSYIELQMPPKIEVESTYSTEARKYPDMFDGPTEDLYTYMHTFKLKLRAVSPTPYRHPLTVEYFTMAEENWGDKHILLLYHKDTILLQNLPNGVYEWESDPIDITTWKIKQYDFTQGEKYAGYLIAVTDARGEIIASKTTRNNWLEHLDNLRQVPVTRMFDENCNRCMPTRPKNQW